MTAWLLREYAATLPHQAYETSFRRSKEAYKSSHSPVAYLPADVAWLSAMLPTGRCHTVKHSHPCDAACSEISLRAVLFWKRQKQVVALIEEQNYGASYADGDRLSAAVEAIKRSQFVGKWRWIRAWSSPVTVSVGRRRKATVRNHATPAGVRCRGRDGTETHWFLPRIPAPKCDTYTRCFFNVRSKAANRRNRIINKSYLRKALRPSWNVLDVRRKSIVTLALS